jgi:hypothetical protein
MHSRVIERLLEITIVMSGLMSMSVAARLAENVLNPQQ